MKLLIALLFLSAPALADDKPFVKITEDGTYRYLESNGIPSHRTGDFPNRANPNAISAQSHKYRVPLNPKKTGKATPKDGVMGVALSGVPFEPSTAECYGRSRGERGPMQTCEWREEAIVNGQGQLGLDHNNAHVQPTGAYHYHGIPTGMVSGELTHVGYAADGFRIIVSRSEKFKPSYRLKSGTRPSGPGGKYDGKYTADFEYVDGLGDLDQCNGREINGEYVYVLTKTFPNAPRCLMGTADASFERRKPQGESGQQRSHSEGRRPPPHGHRHPHHHR
ncbi:MAG: YHYH protein [Pseudomonadota bacterium]